MLWGRIIRDVEPLKGKGAMPDIEAEENRPAETAETGAHLPPVFAEARREAARLRRPERPGGIDRPTRRKLAKGRLDIESRIDLHGMTQAEAHGVLLGFLSRAHARGLRHVLIVTGKGMSMGSEGILRRAVPAWFATPAFRGLVAGYEDAARRHGGGGALYVRLRRGTGGAR